MPSGDRAAPSIALLLSDGFINRTGIGRYQQALIEELSGRINLHALVDERWVGRMSGGSFPPPFRMTPIHRYRRVRTVARNAPRIVGNAVRSRDFRTRDPLRFLETLRTRVLPAAYVDRAGFSLLHGTANYIPRTFGPTARVVTIHDTIPLSHPEGLPKLLIGGFVRPSELRPEDHVITDSQTSLRELRRLFDHPRDRLHAIPLAPDHRVFRPGPTPSNKGPPYVLSVGIIARHKNLLQGLRAFEQVAARRRDLRWKIVGLKGWGWPEFRRALDASTAKDRVDVLGLTTDEGLAEYYRGARALLFPSLVEGFGIPVLEALACGTPVAASSIAVLHEIAEGAFVPFDPSDATGIAEALERAAFDEAERDRLRRNGLDKAAMFTWSKVAEDHLRVYAAALETDVGSLLVRGK